MIFLKEDNYKNTKGTYIQVHAQPNAAKNQIVGQHGERLKIKLKSPPVEGKANKCLIDYLAEIFNIPKNQVALIRGETSREKTIFIYQLSKSQILDVLKLKIDKD